MLMSEEDRRRTAYHEAGHAIVGMFTPGADPVRKVSIIPRGRALGVTLSSPDSDRVSYDRAALDAKIDVALGGRVAEEVVFDTITTGAESDIEQVTGIARAMVGRWGMSEEIGFVAALPADGNPFVSDPPSDETRRLVDITVKRLVDDAHARVTRLLIDRRDALDALAHALLEGETLDMDETYAAAGLSVPVSTLPESQPEATATPGS
jgi:cell division protease FtsH